MTAAHVVSQLHDRGHMLSHDQRRIGRLDAGEMQPAADRPVFKYDTSQAHCNGETTRQTSRSRAVWEW